MITVTRGADVAFTTSFKNSLEQDFEPPSATVRIAYTVDGVPTTDTVSLSLSPIDKKWRASWPTKGADAGQVDWFIDTGGVVDSADQGAFLIVANTANPLQTA